jgi:hypothetical protein
MELVSPATVDIFSTTSHNVSSILNPSHLPATPSARTGTEIFVSLAPCAPTLMSTEFASPSATTATPGTHKPANATPATPVSYYC